MSIAKSSIEQVKEFHNVFGHPIEAFPVVTNKERNALRVALLAEEVEELQDALETGDELEVLDALLDIQYVLDGAFLALGFASVKAEAFAEVHASNMSKLGEDGKPIYREDGKVLKGPNYFKVDLQQFINKLNELKTHGERYVNARDKA